MSSTPSSSKHLPLSNTVIKHEHSSKPAFSLDSRNQSLPPPPPPPFLFLSAGQNAIPTGSVQPADRATLVPLPSITQPAEKRKVNWSTRPESDFERPNNATNSMPPPSNYLPDCLPTAQPRSSTSSASSTSAPKKYHKWTEERRVVLLRIMYEYRRSFAIQKSGVWWNMVNKRYNQIQKAKVMGNQNGVIKGWLKTRKEYRLAHPSEENQPKSSYNSALDMWQEILDDYQAQEDRKKEIQDRAIEEAEGSLNWRESLTSPLSKRRRIETQEEEGLEEEQEDSVNPQSQESPSSVVTPGRKSKPTLQERAYDAIVRIAENTQRGGRQMGVDEKVDQLEKRILELQADIDKKHDEIQSSMKIILEHIANGGKNDS